MDGKDLLSAADQALLDGHKDPEWQEGEQDPRIILRSLFGFVVTLGLVGLFYWWVAGIFTWLFGW